MGEFKFLFFKTAPFPLHSTTREYPLSSPEDRKSTRKIAAEQVPEDSSKVKRKKTKKKEKEKEKEKKREKRRKL